MSTSSFLSAKISSRVNQSTEVYVKPEHRFTLWHNGHMQSGVFSVFDKGSVVARNVEYYRLDCTCDGVSSEQKILDAIAHIEAETKAQPTIHDLIAEAAARV